MPAEAAAQTAPELSVVIAARNEEAHIGDCLRALLSQTGDAGAVRIIVAANACTDDTVGAARALGPEVSARGWQLDVIEVPEPGKIRALNAAEAVARPGHRAFLDADVRCAPDLLGQIRRALDTDAPRYATGTLQVARATTRITRAYASLWTRLPFVAGGAVGAGFFAVNHAGRARWGAFPDIISDDTFARMQFTPEERVEVPATYDWPMVEGFSNLVRVRRRQDEGVAEIHAKYPDLPRNEGKGRLGPGGMFRLMAGQPLNFAVYAAVHLAVRLRRGSGEWTRGR